MAKADVERKIQEVREALDGAKARIQEDIAELKRLIEEGGSTTDIEAALETLKNDVAAIDPVPEFPVPPPPPEEPPVEG